MVGVVIHPPPNLFLPKWLPHVILATVASVAAPVGWISLDAFSSFASVTSSSDKRATPIAWIA